MGVRVVSIQAKSTLADPEPLWLVTVDYGQGNEVEFPLPAHLLATDVTAPMHELAAAEGMESLAAALLADAARIRTKWSQLPPRSSEP